MKKLIILTLFIYPLTAKPADSTKAYSNIIKYNFLPFVSDLFIEFGYERHIYQNISIEVDAAYALPLFGETMDGWYSRRGFRFVAGPRIYTEKKGRLLGLYIAPTVMYKQIDVGGNFYGFECEGNFQDCEYYQFVTERKSVYDGSLRLGYQFGGRIRGDLYFGFGYRYVTINPINVKRAYPGQTILPKNDRRGYINDLITDNRFSLPFGMRLGFAF